MQSLHLGSAILPRDPPFDWVQADVLCVPGLTQPRPRNCGCEKIESQKPGFFKKPGFFPSTRIVGVRKRETSAETRISAAAYAQERTRIGAQGWQGSSGQSLPGDSRFTSRVRLCGEHDPAEVSMQHTVDVLHHYEARNCTRTDVLRGAFYHKFVWRQTRGMRK